jgi:glycerol-3-phosphate dehydrogenase
MVAIQAGNKLKSIHPNSHKIPCVFGGENMAAEYDILIIGGGVIGTAIAARLSQTKAKVCLVEKAGDIAEGASKGNAGGASSYYDPPGTLAERMTTASYKRWEDICERLNVPFHRIGGMIPAFSTKDEEKIAINYAESKACGVRTEMLTKKQAFDHEPMLAKDCLSAVLFPDDGIIDSMRLVFGYAEIAAQNGVDICFHTPVIGFETHDNMITSAITPSGAIRAQFFVNASGVFAGMISRFAGGENFRMWPRKGQYWLLDREFGARINHIVYGIPDPEAGTKGVHIYPTTNRSVLLGPSAEEIEDPYDTATDEKTLDLVFQKAKRIMPSVSLDFAIKSFAANRPACEEPFFIRIDHNVTNLLHAVSRSIGVTTSPGIADYVHDLLIEAGLQAGENTGAVIRLPFIPRLGHNLQPENIDLNSFGKSFSQVVCVCEQVTAGEIEAALKAQIPARSIDGIRKRTGACGGRCQGALCMAGVAFLCSVHGDNPPEKISVREGGNIGIGRVNE